MTQLAPDHTLLLIASFVWGALWGSFLNVVILRLPLGLSLTRPASHCMACKKPIPWYHNIPIISYLVLRGRCASCKTSFSSRYMLVELACGALSSSLYRHLLASVEPDNLAQLLVPFIICFLFILLMLAVTFIDLDHFLIPNVLTVPGMAFGLGANLFFARFTGVAFHEAILGWFLGGGVLLLVIEGYHKITGREGMGGGDFKLMAVVGAFLGWQALPSVFFLSSVQGIAFALLLRITGTRPTPPQYILDFVRHGETGEQNPESDGSSDGQVEDTGDPFGKMILPYGPFIAIAALEYLFFGKHLLQWYNSIMMRM